MMMMMMMIVRQVKKKKKSYTSYEIIGELFDQLLAVSREGVPGARQRDPDDGRRLYVPGRALLLQIPRQINQVNHYCYSIY